MTYCKNDSLSSGVQSSGDGRGDCLIVFPLPNSSIGQWRMVVIVSGYTLFGASQYDVKFTQGCHIKNETGNYSNASKSQLIQANEIGQFWNLAQKIN